MKDLISKYLSAGVKKILATRPAPKGWSYLLRSSAFKNKDGTASLRYRGEDKGKVAFDVQGAVFLPCPVSDEAVLAYLRSRPGTTAYDVNGAPVTLNGAQKAAWTIAKLEAEQFRGSMRKASASGAKLTDETVQEYLLGMHAGRSAEVNISEEDLESLTPEQLIAKLRASGVKITVTA